MNKTTKIIIAVVAILIAVAVVVTIIMLNGKKDKSNLNISSTEDMENLVSQIYEGTKTLPSLMTTVVDMAQPDSITYVTGLTSADKIDAIVVSEPMMSSQAYSMVLVKVKDAKDADSIAKEMNEKINANKWICVSADKVYTTSSGNIVCLVMSSEEMAKPVYDKFKELAGSVGEEYLRDNNEGIIDDGTLTAM